MLTPEDKKRIEEEEAYRAEVRKSHRGVGFSGQPATVKVLVGSLVIALVFVMAVGILSLLPSSFFNNAIKTTSAADPSSPEVQSKLQAKTEAAIAHVPDTPAAPPPPPPMHVYRHNIISGPIVVNAMQSTWFRIDVPRNAEMARVGGQFSAVGGLQNDIEAGLLDSLNLTNWVNGHQATGLWFSGRVTTAQLNVLVAPGSSYYLAFNNRIALLSAKTINAEIILAYKAVSSFDPSDTVMIN